MRGLIAESALGLLLAAEHFQNLLWSFRASVRLIRVRLILTIRGRAVGLGGLSGLDRLPRLGLIIGGVIGVVGIVLFAVIGVG